MTEVSLEKSHGHSAADAHAKHEALRIENFKLGWWLYLASEVVLFTVLIATFVVFRIDNPEVVKEVHEKAGVLLVALNTFILLTSSWAMVMGLREIQRGNVSGLVRWIGLTAVMGTIFLLLQWVEYNTLGAEGITLQSGQFGMRFYAPTAFHGAHVLIGVIWAVWVMWRARNGKYSSTNYLGVEVFGLYWHFVDVVWIVLFTLIYLV